MTSLNKPVTRRSDAAMIRDGGNLRRIVVTIYPNGTLGLRPEKTRREEIIPIAAAWSLGVKQRISAERADKKAARKAKGPRR